MFTESFFTWTTLATMAGAVAATVGITQIFKGVSFIDRIPTRLFSYIVALLILIAATVITTGFAWESIGLCVINAVVVALAAQGAYDGVTGGTML